MMTGALIASCSPSAEESAGDSPASVASMEGEAGGANGGSTNADGSPQPTAGDAAEGSSTQPAGDNPGSEEPVADGACLTSQLKVETSGQQGGAGSMLFNLVFTNTSDSSCSLNGFPGVSLVTDNNGTQLGNSAVREDVSFEPVMLDPGAAAIAPVQLTSTGPLDPKECQPTPADGLRVYPPGEKKSAYVPMSNVEGCKGDVDILSVQPVGLAGS